MDEGKELALAGSEFSGHDRSFLPPTTVRAGRPVRLIPPRSANRLQGADNGSVSSYRKWRDLAAGVVRHQLCPHRMNVSLEIDPELVQYLTAIAHDDAICAEFPIALHVRQRLKARAEIWWVQAVARREGLPPLPRLTTRCSIPLQGT